MTVTLINFLLAEDGPTSVEYAIMLAMILVAVISAIAVIGGLTLDSLNFSQSEMERTFPEL